MVPNLKRLARTIIVQTLLEIGDNDNHMNVVYSVLQAFTDNVTVIWLFFHVVEVKSSNLVPNLRRLARTIIVQITL